MTGCISDFNSEGTYLVHVANQENLEAAFAKIYGTWQPGLRGFWVIGSDPCEYWISVDANTSTWVHEHEQKHCKEGFYHTW